jgi:hypothetical protein
MRRILLLAVFVAAFAVGLTQEPASARGGEKVEVCHNDHEIEVSTAAVPAHLAHGDFLGSCDGGCLQGTFLTPLPGGGSFCALEPEPSR